MIQGTFVNTSCSEKTFFSINCCLKLTVVVCTEDEL